MELRRPKSARSSFHTTICVLEGQLEYERAVGSAPARRRGEEYLLERGLFRRRSTGAVVHPAFLELAFPPSYHYDVLRALDYFRDADDNSDVRPDARIRDAVQFIESKRQTGVPNAPVVGAMGWKAGVPDAPVVGAMGWKAGVPDAPDVGAMGWKADDRWLLDRAYDEALALPCGESVGEPSRWNTLRARRVLRWYERRGLQPTSTP